MKTNQLTRGQERRLMYVENKDGLLDGSQARIGWVAFSRSGRSIRYRGRSLVALRGGGLRGNYMDEETREEFWVSGVKQRGSNAHPTGSTAVVVDDDAREAYSQIRGLEG